MGKIENKEQMISRLEQIRKEKRLPAKEFCQKAGVDNSNYSKAVNGKINLSDDMIRRFCKTYNISEAYLRFGHDYSVHPQDDMIGKTVKNLINKNSEVLKLFEGIGEMRVQGLKHEPQKHMSLDKKGVPYYNVSFSMSFDLLGEDSTSKPDYMIDFEPYNNCDVWCNAHGNSMAPTISNGDIVALKKIWDIKYLINREIYAIQTKSGLRTIKRVKDNGDTITLIADNKEYEPQTIPKNEIEQIFIVKGSMKVF